MCSTFGDYLKNLRVKENLTQFELAKKLNLSNASISYIEKNQIYPSKKILKAYHEYFSIPEEELYEQSKFERDKHTIASLIKKINENNAELKNYYLDPNTDIQLKNMIKEAFILNTDYKNTKYIGNKDFSIVDIQYFSDLKEYKNKLNNKDYKYKLIEKSLPRNIYSAPNNLFAIRNEFISMNTIIPINSVLTVDVKGDIKSNDIILYKLNNKIELARVYIYDTYIELNFESNDPETIINHSNKVIQKEHFKEKKFIVLGKIIDVKIHNKYLNL